MKTKKSSEALRAARRELLAAERALEGDQRQAMAGGGIRTVEGLELSEKNQILLAIQGGRRGIAVRIVGGFRQWKVAGRTVRKGEKALTICFPRTKKNDDTGDDELAGFGWGSVFDISQTAEISQERQADMFEPDLFDSVADPVAVADPANGPEAANPSAALDLNDLNAAIAAA